MAHTQNVMCCSSIMRSEKNCDFRPPQNGRVGWRDPKTIKGLPLPDSLWVHPCVNAHSRDHIVRGMCLKCRVECLKTHAIARTKSFTHTSTQARTLRTYTLPFRTSAKLRTLNRTSTHHSLIWEPRTSTKEQPLAVFVKIEGLHFVHDFISTPSANQATKCHEEEGTTREEVKKKWQRASNWPRSEIC